MVEVCGTCKQPRGASHVQCRKSWQLGFSVLQEEKPCWSSLMKKKIVAVFPLCVLCACGIFFSPPPQLDLFALSLIFCQEKHQCRHQHSCFTGRVVLSPLREGGMHEKERCAGDSNSIPLAIRGWHVLEQSQQQQSSVLNKNSVNQREILPGKQP